MSLRDELAGVLARDPRYSIHAYALVFEALDHTKRLKKRSRPRGRRRAADPSQHVTGREVEFAWRLRPAPAAGGGVVAMRDHPARAAAQHVQAHAATVRAHQYAELDLVVETAVEVGRDQRNRGKRQVQRPGVDQFGGRRRSACEHAEAQAAARSAVRGDDLVAAIDQRDALRFQRHALDRRHLLARGGEQGGCLRAGPARLVRPAGLFAYIGEGQAAGIAHVLGGLGEERRFLRAGDGDVALLRQHCLEEVELLAAELVGGAKLAAVGGDGTCHHVRREWWLL